MKLTITFISIFFANVLLSQNYFKENYNFEFGGKGLFLSINYEKQILKQKKLNAHIGVGIYGISKTYITLPIGVNYLINLKEKQQFVEVGLAATYTKANVKLYIVVDNKSNYSITSNHLQIIPNISYRHNGKKKIVYKLSFTPVINNNGLLPFLGLTIGRMF